MYPPPPSPPPPPALQIDANCDEEVDWDEYLGYMLLEFQEKDIMHSMSVTQPFPKPKIYVRYL